MREVPMRQRKGVVFALLALLLVTAGMLGKHEITPSVVHAGSAPPSVSISPTSGHPGTIVSISATNFPGFDTDGGIATILFDATNVGAPGFRSCDDSSFAGFGTGCSSPSGGPGPTVTFTVPASATAGRHKVSVQDQSGNSGSTFFTVILPATNTPTSTPVPTATFFPTTTLIPTSIPTSTPRPTNTPTPTPTATTPPTTLPTAPACPTVGVSALAAQPLVHFGASGHALPRTTYAAGTSISIQGTGLPPNLAVNLFYNGPRRNVQGSTSNLLPYSVLVGTSQTDGNGNLNARLTLPLDAAAGSGTILAYRVTGVRTAALMTWKLDTDYHAPFLKITGAPGTPFLVNPGGQLSGVGACSGTIGSGGSSFIQVPPGTDTISYQPGGPGGPIHSFVGLENPGATNTFNALNILNNACVTSGIQITSVLDEFSGEEGSLTGGGPLGYYLSQQQVDDEVVVAASGPHGGVLAHPPAASADLIRPDGSVAQHYGTLPQSSGSNLQTFITTVLGPPGAQLAGAAATQIGANNTVYSFTMNPGLLPTGRGVLRVHVGACLQDVQVDIAPSHWHSGAFNVAATSFDTSARTYVGYGSVPFNLPMLDSQPFGPNGLGWAGVGPIPAYHYHADNNFTYGLFLGEAFTTTGTWNGVGSLGIQAKLLGLDLTSLIPPFNQDQRPDDLSIPHQFQAMNAPGNVNSTWGLGGDLAPNLQPSPNPPGYTLSPVTVWQGQQELAAADLPLKTISIPVCGKVGLGVHLTVGLTARMGASTTINPTLTAGTSSLSPQGSVFLSAGLRAGICSAVLLEMGIQGKIDVAFPMTYDFSHPLNLGGSPPNPQALNCLSGSASANMTLGIHLWNINSPITIFNVPLLSVNDTTPGCPTPSSRRERLMFRRLTGHDPPPVPHLQMRAVTPSSNPASPSVAIDSKGHGATVWVRSVHGADTLMSALGPHGKWGKTRAITRVKTAITQPHVAALGNGNFMATWVQNTLSKKNAATVKRLSKSGKGTKALGMILQHQEIYTSTYSHGKWSHPRRMTRNTVADASPAISADGKSGQAMLVWTRAGLKGHGSLIVSRYNGRSWTAPKAVPGTASGDPRQPSLASWSGTRYALDWIAGPTGGGKVHMLTWNGSRWTRMAAPGLTGAVTDTALTARGTGLAMGASVQPRTGKRLWSGETGMWSATYAKGKWKVKKVANVGDSPSISADSTGDAVLTFLQPKSTDATTGSNSVGVSVALPGKQFSSSVGAVHQGSANTNYLSPASALDGSTGQGKYVEVGQSKGSSGATVTGGTGQTAIAGKKNKSLDNAGSVESTTIAFRPHPVVDLTHAALTATHPIPGTQVNIIVPIRNEGLAPGKTNQTLTIEAGGKTIGTAPVVQQLGPNAAGKVSIPITVPADAMIVKNGTSSSSAVSQELGLPIVPQNLVAAPQPDGDVALQWSPQRDHDISSYDVYRQVGQQWELVGLAQDNAFVDPNAAGQGAQYAVTALDSLGRESQLSPAASASQLGQGPPQKTPSPAVVAHFRKVLQKLHRP